MSDAMRCQIVRLQRALYSVLPLAEAWHRRTFDSKCDHDEDCQCDNEAKTREIIRAAKAEADAPIVW